MANIKSAEKANRQRIKRTARNTAQMTAMRTIVKRLRAAEAADIMAIPVGTLTSRLSRGREALAASLGGKEQVA